MKIGTPKETKNHEYRVGLTPDGVSRLVAAGHQVFVERFAGDAVGFSSQAYQGAGAVIVDSAAELYGVADLIVKIKEPQPAEYHLLQPHHTLFAYLHLAPDPQLVDCLLAARVTGIAYETVEDSNGRLPLLAPMSEVAGKLATQIGAHYLEKAQGGYGILLGGAGGVAPAKVLVIGGGVVGSSATQIALGMGADVTLVDRSPAVLEAIAKRFDGRVKTLISSEEALASLVKTADLLIGAVLVPGATAPKVVSAAMIKTMRKGSVVVDVAIDQGGCFETSRPTSHDNPVYSVDGVTHYCVTNIPSAAACTATLALTAQTLPYVMDIAGKGVIEALKTDGGLRKGLNVCNGHITYAEIARAQQRPSCPVDELF